MAEQRERKPGTGVAFTNKNKKEDWHADWTGEFADLQGNIYYLNVSKKVSGHSNQEYISVSLGKLGLGIDAATLKTKSHDEIMLILTGTYKARQKAVRLQLLSLYR